MLYPVISPIFVFLLVRAKRRVAGWVAGGCWDDDITSDEMDHSRKFPTFSTSKLKILRWLSLFFIWQGKITDVSLRWSTDPYQWEIFQRSRGTSDCFSECWWRSPSAWHHVVFLFFCELKGNEQQTCGVTWREHLNRKWIFSSNLGFL